MIGTKLAHYEITGHLGTGGMGEVYEATDSKLGRSVAIKLLPEAFARDTERVARFDREGRVLASLNHPNIAAIHGLEESAGRKFLVMELVPGETLAQRIVRGAVPIDESLTIARQICEALEAAHEKGVIHRDLKPANVKITPDGKVKVLDFGLAKAFESEPGNATLSNSPTLSMSGTNAGVILGTAAYMSPEQASGQKVDKRADIWSFGVLVWEMLTGKRLFNGETISHTIADVLRREIDFSQLPATTPATIRTLLRRCLDRDVKGRLRDIGEARIAIENSHKEPEGKLVPDRPSRIAWIWAAVATVATVAAVAFGFAGYFQATPEAPRVLKMSLLPPEKASLVGDIPAVSPNGQQVAFEVARNGKTELWVRNLGSLDARALEGTEGASLPFWSHDNRFLGFFANGKLKRIAATGGPVSNLCDAPDGRGGTWNQNDIILFVPSIISPILRVSAAGGGTPVPVTMINEQEPGHRYPWFLPDGRHFLYTAYGPTPEKDTVYVADLESGDRRALIAAPSNVVYASGYLLFLRDLTLMAQPFDADKLRTTGDPVPIAEHVGYLSLDIRAYFSSSQNGVLVYDSPDISNLFGYTQLTWFDRLGKKVGTVGDPAGLTGAAISPDGNSVAASLLNPQSGRMDIYLYDPVSGKNSRFTYNSQNNFQPVWSPDSGAIVFYSSPGGSSTVYRKALGQSGHEEILDKSTSIRSAVNWSRDDRYIIEETHGDPKSGDDVWVLPLLPERPGGDKKPFPYLHTNANESSPRLSPNGQWLAYQSDETTRNEIYVQTFPMLAGQKQVSTNGGSHPEWSRDGTELFYIAADGKMMVVEVKIGREFDHGTPKTLFDMRAIGAVSPQGAPYDVSKDQRFLIPVSFDMARQNGVTPITVEVNWTTRLKGREN